MNSDPTRDPWIHCRGHQTQQHGSGAGALSEVSSGAEEVAGSRGARDPAGRRSRGAPQGARPGRRDGLGEGASVAPIEGGPNPSARKGHHHTDPGLGWWCLSEDAVGRWPAWLATGKDVMRRARGRRWCGGAGEKVVRRRGGIRWCGGAGEKVVRRHEAEKVVRRCGREEVVRQHGGWE